jgi:predicted transcriptional regulator
MGRAEQAAELLKEGNSPSKIAQEMKISLASVKQYLYLKVGEGKIRRSDIVFSIDEEVRNKIESIISQHQQNLIPPYKIFRLLTKEGERINQDDVNIYCELRDARVSLGDMYEDIRDIETQLHSKIKKILIEEFGTENWWRDGIPVEIRCSVVESRERDVEPIDEYCYTNFRGLRKILDAKWKIFKGFLPKNVGSNKRELLARLDELNRIRNSVMHPVRNYKFTDKEFSFVRGAKEYLQLEKW